MRNCLHALLCMALLLPSQATHAVDVVLKNNPFEPPVLKETKETGRNTGQKSAGPAMSLRATMAAGAYSLANIGGEIVGIGEQVNGYKLVEVHPRHIVLEKNDTRKTLSVDNEMEKQQ